jgi:hypothetical protein
MPLNYQCLIGTQYLPRTQNAKDFEKGTDVNIGHLVLLPQHCSHRFHFSPKVSIYFQAFLEAADCCAERWISRPIIAGDNSQPPP